MCVLRLAAFSLVLVLLNTGYCLVQQRSACARACSVLVGGDGMITDNGWAKSLRGKLQNGIRDKVQFCAAQCVPMTGRPKSLDRVLYAPVRRSAHHGVSLNISSSSTLGVGGRFAYFFGPSKYGGVLRYSDNILSPLTE